MKNVLLQPKCYCLKLEGDSVKRAAKGVPRFQQKTLSYEKYNEIYTRGSRGENFTVTSIRSDKAELVTKHETRQGLFFMDLKRYYFDIDHSVAYRHPSIPEPMDSTNLPSTSSRPAKRPREDALLVLETNEHPKKNIEAILKRRRV